MNRAAIAAILILVTAIAGCTESPTLVEPSSPDENPAQPAILTSEDLGAIAGTVVDNSVFPLPNITVRLSDTGQTAPLLATVNTKADGAFSFPLLEPRTYKVAASGSGFANRSALVSVIAGEIARTTLMLTDVASEEPYVELVVKNGIVTCTFATPMWPGDSTGCGGSSEGYVLNFQVPDGFQAIVGETTWATTDWLSQSYETLNQTSSAATGAWMDIVVGRDGLREQLFPGEKKPQANPNAAFANIWIPVPTESFLLSVRTYYSGQFADEMNQTMNPVCTSTFMPRCGGLGAVIELRFSLYLSVFMNGVPEGIHTYSALPDR